MNSIFGIGVLEFVFILIFALIFLGPERLPKVTRDVLQFIRRLQKLSGDLTRQVNEEIGDIRELDPSYHMKELMGEEEETDKQAKEKVSNASKRQTSAPSQPQATQTIGAETAPATTTGETIAPEPAASTAQPALANLNASASTNGRKAVDEKEDAKPEKSGTSNYAKPRSSSSKAPKSSPVVGAKPQTTNNKPSRGVKTLAELRKQQRAKRQTGSSDANSSYLEERNKRAVRRADDRRQAVAAQKVELTDDSGANAASPEAGEASPNNNIEQLASHESGKVSTDGAPGHDNLPVERSSSDAGETPVSAVSEAQED